MTDAGTIAEPSLAMLQAWLQDRVMAGTWHAGQDDAGIRAVVAGSAALSAERRVGLYASSYVARLAECMRAEFPILRALVGDQVFNLFVGGYLSARPPASYSLYHLGAGFADYLEATRPRPHSGPGTAEALPASLARLERAMAESERAEGVEGRIGTSPARDPLMLLQDPGLHDAASQDQAWQDPGLPGPGAWLRVPQTLRLLRLDFDFTATLAMAPGTPVPAMPVPCETLVAVARSEYRVQVHRLEPWAFAWLAALAETDGDVRAATHAAAFRSGRSRGAVLAELLAWLPAAITSGFVG